MIEGHSYFWIRMKDEDYLILLTLAKHQNISKEEFIMRAIRDYVLKMQDEWKRVEGGDIVGRKGKKVEGGDGSVD